MAGERRSQKRHFMKSRKPDSQKAGQPEDEKTKKPEKETRPQFGIPDRLSKIRRTTEQVPGGTKLQLLDIGDVELKTCLFDTYITAETEDEVYFIDQHVASERVLYERYVNQLNENGIPTQGLLLPVTIDLSPAQLEVFRDNSELLKDIGFDIELFGGNTILVRAVPSILSNKLIAQTVTELIDKL
jgi:DNA mismatch repair protein MutL